MTAFEENPSPYLTLEEILSDGSTLTNPAADFRKLFLGEDGYLHLRDSAGTITDPIAASSGIAATIFDARGDIITASAADTAQRLALGSAFSVLSSDGTDATWGTRIIRGQIATDGTITRGTGFSAVRDSAGVYTITYTVAFGAAGIVVATPFNIGGLGQIATVAVTTASGFQVATFNGAGATDVAFTFVAITV